MPRGSGKVEPLPVEFDDAIERTATRTRYLLLGNGFSISARATFAYQSLYRGAGKFSPGVEALFQRHETEDFEHVLSVLKSNLADGATDPETRATWKEQEEEVRSGFIRSLSSVHPDSSAFMGDDECHACGSFLEHFVGRSRPLKVRGRLYTTNYDLLLYWAIVRNGRRLWCHDSHISPMEDKRYGVWNPEKPPGVVYLHGALHLYPFGSGQAMLRYHGDLSLIEQTRRRLNDGRFPVIVSEGTSEAKASRIARSGYLTWAGKYLRSGMRDRNGVLVTFGHGLNDRDAHLIRAIGQGRISTVYVGAWGGLGGSQGPDICQWAERWWEARRSRPQDGPLEVRVYDTSKLSPWRAPPIQIGSPFRSDFARNGAT